MRTKTFASASSDIANYGVVCEGESPSKTAQHVARFFATSPQSSGSATIELALVVAGACVARFTGTATVTARRTAAGGASGDYICDVVWSESQTSKADLLGMTNMPGGGAGVGGTTTAQGNSGYSWYVGATSFSTITSLSLHWITTSVT